MTATITYTDDRTLPVIMALLVQEALGFRGSSQRSW
jgi:hypothetical protein